MGLPDGCCFVVVCQKHLYCPFGDNKSSLILKAKVRKAEGFYYAKFRQTQYQLDNGPTWEM